MQLSFGAQMLGIGGQPQTPQMPDQAGYPGVQGYGGPGGYQDNSGYTPFSSQGMETIRRTPRYQMGATPMYGQAPFVHRGNAERTDEQQLAFEHGVDLFCKQAGFDEEDRLAMHKLIKKAGWLSDGWGNIKTFFGYGDNPARQNDPAFWQSAEGLKESDRLDEQRSREGKITLSPKQWSDYYVGSAQRAAARNPAAADELAKGQSGEFGKGHWAARNAITMGATAPLGFVGGTLLGGAAAAAPYLYQASKEQLTPGADPGSAPGPVPMSMNQPAQDTSVPAFNRQSFFPGGGGQGNGGWLPGGELDQKSQAAMGTGGQSSLAQLKAQESTFAQQGRDATAYRDQTALNAILQSGKDPRMAIIQHSRGDLPMMHRLAKSLNVELPGGFRSTQTGGTRYDPSGGTSRTTRSSAPRTSGSTGSYQAPGVQGAGVPPAPEGASQFPGGWVAKSKDSGAGISQGDTARRDLQRRMGTNKFFGLQGQSTSAQNPSTLGMAEAAGLAGPSGGSSARFTGSIEDYERQNPQAGVVASAPTSPTARSPAAMPHATVGSGFSRPGSTPKSAPAPTKPATMQTYYNRPQIPEGLESATSTPMQGYV
jgi:hypothetical protein